MNPQASLRVLGVQRLQIPQHAAEAQGANVVAQGERLAAHVDDVQAFQLQVAQRNAHGDGEARRRGVLEFEPEAATAPNDRAELPAMGTSGRWRRGTADPRAAKRVRDWTASCGRAARERGAGRFG